MITNFEKKLESLLNECSMENGSDTPDFILAGYLQDCLTAFNTAMKIRESWYGRDMLKNKNIEMGAPFDEDLYKKGTGNPPDVLPSTTSIDPQKIIDIDNTKPMIDIDNSNPMIDLKS